MMMIVDRPVVLVGSSRRMGSSLYIRHEVVATGIRLHPLHCIE